MNYDELKRSLEIKPTLLDAGFPPDFGSGKYAESDYLPGKVDDRRKLRAPVGGDLSYLNGPNSRRLQRLGRQGGKKARK